MRRLLTYTLAAVFLVASSGLAVEKKKAEPSKKQAPAASTVKKAEPKKPAPAKTQAAPKQRSYDSFVDQNKNGIDDRKEKGSKQAVKKPAPPKVEPKKAAADSTKKKK